MPDDKMRNQQAGQKGREDQGHGQQTAGRNPQDDKSTGQHSGGGMNKPMHDDKGLGGGQSGQKGQGTGQKR